MIKTMSATSKLLQQALPTTGTKSNTTQPVSNKSATAALLQASGISGNELAYIPKENLPVVEPKKTLGEKVVEFTKDIAKDAASTLLVKPAARTTEAITRTVFPESLAAKGYEAMSQEGQPQVFKTPLLGDITVNPIKAFGEGGGKQIVGEALKSAAYLAPYSKIAQGAGATILGGSKLTPAALKTAQLLGDVVAGGIGGAAFGGGSAMEQGLDTKEVLKQTAIGAGLGVVAPVAIRGVTKLLKGKPKVPTTTTEEVIPKIEPSISKEIPKTQELPITQPKIKQTPEYIASVQKRKQVLDKDPEFVSSANEQVIRSFDEKILSKDKTKAIDYAVGKDTNIIPEVPRSAALKLMREDVLANPNKYTTKEINRLTSNYATSQAGKDLQASQITRKAFIDNPFDAITLANRELKDKFKKAGITKKSITNFLDNNECK